jgi:hypothetical protein
VTSSRPRVFSSSRTLLLAYKLAARAENFWHERRKIPSQNSTNNLRENSERHTEEAWARQTTTDLLMPWCPHRTFRELLQTSAEIATELRNAEIFDWTEAPS